MEDKLRPQEIFHLVGNKTPKDHEANYETLGKVLRSGCVSYYPHHNDFGNVEYKENLGGIGLLEKGELIIPSVTCYADIPFEDLEIHAHKYGHFGISLPLSFMVQCGARPVMYIPMRSDDWRGIHGITLLRDIESVANGFNEHVEKKYSSEENSPRSLGKMPMSTEEAIAAMGIVFKKDFLAFIKAFDSELAVNNQDNYYMEREWRKYGNMQFKAEQVERVVVAKGYTARVANDFPEYKERIYEIKIAD